MNKRSIRTCQWYFFLGKEPHLLVKISVDDEREALLPYSSSICQAWDLAFWYNFAGEVKVSEDFSPMDHLSVVFGIWDII
ncbi:hypothetical protein PT974_04798 [Cladobotryum mycophilum]|uniref:Uncharacterized protein n=1 Tax=Cladobotryum mycophilum TaxID=491253 RepID=A0ABR0SRH6_9HYPO